MMPNLTGVEPYLYSLHSRFCFKGFVYTRPINHLLPPHKPAAFKVGAARSLFAPRDNVQLRCQSKSLPRSEKEDGRPSGHPLLSGFSIISSSSLCPWPRSLSRHIAAARPQRAPINKHPHLGKSPPGQPTPPDIV
ncbi:Hypothetical predicted protein [Xyrichtys novacula]|uniref:Uncharacterized protein n=1 Tax=Xyrichtys novacula TaxID=13765 RepID=A0AAV1G4I7_XYRNO|nr:Hypothetical predicted protein [Xyrichtys novacula]